ncbi:MAG: putative ABC transporter permease [Lachnospiraceae bacterium]|nr:putative ABC transporter permease [Lachnospiraceae bacterium]
MILGLTPYFILMNFYIFSFFGWIYESTFVSIRNHKLINRGVLNGPLLPLYGTGATIVYILLRPFEAHPSLLFILGMVIATITEYIVALLLEKLTHAKWWDYSNEPYNFQGRVALIPSLFWGFLSIFLFDFLEPFVIKIIDFIPASTGVYLLTAAIILTLADLSYTIFTTINFSKQLEALYNFRNEIENQLQDIRFKTLYEIITSTSINFNNKKKAVYHKINSLKEMLGTDARLLQIEERFKNYFDRHSKFLKKHPLNRNLRILDAFPTMKFVPKNKKLVDVREFLTNLNIKTNKNKDKDLDI